MAALTICTSVLKIRDQLGAAYSTAELTFEPRKSQVHSADSLYINKIKRAPATPSQVIQDITFIATSSLTNLVTIIYTPGATAGAEIVTVVDNAITVQIETGVSTATQVLNAVTASVTASALVTPYITGTAGTAQVSFTPAVTMTDYVCVLKLAETTTDSQPGIFTLNWNDGSNYNSVIFDPIQVPNQSYLDLSTLLTVSRG